MFTVSDGYIPIGLAYIRPVTGPACKLIDATFFVVLCVLWFIIAVIGFSFLSYCVGGFKCYVEFSVFEYVSFLILGLKYENVVHCLLLSCLVMLVFCWFCILV